MSEEHDRLVAELFDLHYAGLCRLAALLLDDDGEAQDVVREAFVRAFSGWRRILRHDRIQWHLRAAVVNLSRKRLRRRSSEHRSNRKVRRYNDRRSATREDEEVSDVVDVLDAVQSLPERQREAVVLFYYLDLPIAEIAATVSSDTDVVRSLLLKARGTLARLLADADGRRRPRAVSTAAKGKRQPNTVLMGRDGAGGAATETADGDDQGSDAELTESLEGDAVLITEPKDPPGA